MKYFYLSVVFLFFGCKKDPTNNGSSQTQLQTGQGEIIYTNGACSIKPQSLSSPNELFSAYYKIDSNYTAIAMRGVSLSSLMVFKGNHIGSYMLNDTLRHNGLSITDVGEFLCDTTYSELLGADSVILNITKYESVGGIIEGNWSGKLTGIDIARFKTKTVYANGSFSVVRKLDE